MSDGVSFPESTTPMIDRAMRQLSVRMGSTEEAFKTVRSLFIQSEINLSASILHSLRGLYDDACKDYPDDMQLLWDLNTACQILDRIHANYSKRNIDFVKDAR